MRNCTSSGTVEQGPPLPANRNDGFLSGENVRPLVEMVDDRIRALFSGGQDPDILYEAARHLLLAGGKRIRSLLTLMSCQAVGGAPEEALPLAVALELVQTASIIHDDIIDGDTQRRGVEATHVRFGTKMAILAGDLLVGLALREIARLSKPLILRELGEIGIAMCEGEILDTDLTIDRIEHLNTTKYLDVIQRKTAAFVRGAALLGAIVGGGTEEHCEQLAKYGMCLGMAFQLRDDVLDLTAQSSELGKPVRSDLRNRRCTYPILYALQNLPSEERSTCISELRAGNVRPLLVAIESTGAIQRTTELGQEYCEQAKREITGIGLENETMLCDLADFAVNRTF